MKDNDLDQQPGVPSATGPLPPVGEPPLARHEGDPPPPASLNQFPKPDFIIVHHEDGTTQVRNLSCRRASLPVTPERRKVFLETLEKTGSLCAAAFAATPWALGVHRGADTFRDLAARDPEFALQVKEARERFLGQVETVIADHVLKGTQRPIYQHGRLVGHETVWDHNLMLRAAARLDPSWAERTKQEISGKLETVNRSLDVSIHLDPRDVLLLEDGDRALFMQLIELIAERKDEQGRERDQEVPLPDQVP